MELYIKQTCLLKLSQYVPQLLILRNWQTWNTLQVSGIITASLLQWYSDTASKPSVIFLMPATDAAMFIIVHDMDRLTGNAVGGQGSVPPPKLSTVAILGSDEDFCGKLHIICKVVTDAKAASFCWMWAASTSDEEATEDTWPVTTVNKCT